MAKRPLGVNVLLAARERISRVFDDFPRIYVSFSAGKDSGVMLHLVLDEAQRRKRKVGVLFVDLEAQYKMTIDYAAEMFKAYADWIEPYWVALPLNLRNAVSQFEPQWMCWDPDRRADWVREPHHSSITDESFFPFFRRRMEFEEFVPAFGHWYAQGKLCACFVGIRTDESLNRWRTISAGRKSSFEGLRWTTWIGSSLYNVYPIYDWRTEDIWIFNGKFKAPYNRLYDRMHQAGLTISQQRICQPYGDDQRKGLWLFHVIEPETWGRIVNRVSGANQGALYVQESGNVLGQRKVSKPDGITWQEYAHRLLESMPPSTAENYRNKIAVFLRWYAERGYRGGIPDEGPIADRSTPSWTRICRAMLRNDYWCKGLSFSQHKTEAFAKYQKLMKKRRAEWALI
jgi:predicted phosphoadenosine phosphosulfate sulfurtransferase